MQQFFRNYIGTDLYTTVHSSYGVKARHGDGGAPGRLGARLAHLGARLAHLGARLARLGAHSARRWGSAWTPRRRLGDAMRTMLLWDSVVSCGKT
jgi:hypothetical protein